VIELKFAILDSQSINFVLTGFFSGCMQWMHTVLANQAFRYSRITCFFFCCCCLW